MWLFTVPQGHKTDGVVFLRFQIRPCYGDPTKTINRGTERSSSHAQKEATEDFRRSDHAHKAAEAVFIEGQSTFEGKEYKQALEQFGDVSSISCAWKVGMHSPKRNTERRRICCREETLV